MKKAATILLLLFSTIAFAQQAKGVAKIGLQPLLDKVTKADGNTLYVVNFWATWCAPCVKELPYFEDANKKYAGKNVKVVLVSLDFLSEEANVTKFVSAKKLQSDVYLLNAGNPNDWIDKFDPAWDGAIPATVMYKAGKKVYFRQGDFEAAELDSLIQIHIK